MFNSDVGECILIVVQKIGECYTLQSCLLKQELEQDEIFEGTWESREEEWLPYVKNDVLSTAFCDTLYTMGQWVWKK